ncbi:MAG TPA: UbiX family flavin prenyltransferase [Methanocorpusculum sp.]|nr:UbiX family flavin prenyltransferase [Methanocorpusculum sp.]HJK80357.1 UbiX family flavin prenyltransferase [Methanocorpusculum sp.]
MKRIVVGVTGASGTLYAKRLIEALTKTDGIEVYLIISDTARTVARLEEVDLSGYPVHYEENCDLSAGIASGSFLFDAMVVIPCSMKSLAAIANGYSTTLIARAADVALKERRKLILVPRETPYSRVHLTNMLAAHDAGAVILPASPPLYTHPQTIADLADLIASRVLDHCGIPHTIGSRWKE